MRNHGVLYGLLGGVLIAGLRLIEYRWLVVEHSVEIYGGHVAAVFASVGIWLGLRLTGPPKRWWCGRSWYRRRPTSCVIRAGSGRSASRPANSRFWS